MTQVLLSDTYRVTELDKTKASRFTTMAHVSQLKGWTSTTKKTHLKDDTSSSEEAESTREEVTVQLPKRSARRRAIPK